MHKMSSLIEIDPEKAKKVIADAFIKAKCHYQDAAAILGASRGTYRQWVRVLNMKSQLDAIEKKAVRQEWHHGRKGGAGFHRDPESRVRKAVATRSAKKALGAK